MASTPCAILVDVRHGHRHRGLSTYATFKERQQTRSRLGSLQTTCRYLGGELPSRTRGRECVLVREVESPQDETIPLVLALNYFARPPNPQLFSKY